MSPLRLFLIARLSLTLKLSVSRCYCQSPNWESNTLVSHLCLLKFLLCFPWAREIQGLPGGFLWRVWSSSPPWRTLFPRGEVLTAPEGVLAPSYPPWWAAASADRIDSAAQPMPGPAEVSCYSPLPWLWRFHAGPVSCGPAEAALHLSSFGRWNALWLPAAEELNLHMALLNTRSLVNKTFLLNDLFTSWHLDFMLNSFLPAVYSSAPLGAPAEVVVWPRCSNPAFSAVLFHLLPTPALNCKRLSYNFPLSPQYLRLFIALQNLIRTSFDFATFLSGATVKYDHFLISGDFNPLWIKTTGH